jgi:hypothetical protein
MSIFKNPGGENSGELLSRIGHLSEHSSAGELAEGTGNLDDQIIRAQQHLTEIKYKPNLTAKELEEAEDYLRELQQKKRSLSNQ